MCCIVSKGTDASKYIICSRLILIACGYHKISFQSLSVFKTPQADPLARVNTSNVVLYTHAAELL